MNMENIEKEIKGYIKNGVYLPNEIFNRIYPTAVIHAAKLRDLISKVKNGY